jgi:hypothetical protein
MLYIAHRVNTAAHLANVPPDQGVEVDVRDHGDRLVLQHDPFHGAAGEEFESYLDAYHHRLLILNIKSERIEFRVREVLQHRGIEDYFFLDSTIPMIRTLLSIGERRIAVRFSECEPIESALAFAGHAEWVWVDCFTRMPLTPDIYERLVSHFQLCVVSPELHGRPVEEIAGYAHALAAYPFHAVCSKRVDLWRRELETP